MRRPATFKGPTPEKDIHGWILGFIPESEYANTQVIFETISGNLRTEALQHIKIDYLNKAGHVTRDHAAKVISKWMEIVREDDVNECSPADAVDELFDENLFYSSPYGNPNKEE